MVNGINSQRQMVDPSQYYANSYANQVMNSGDETFSGLAPIGGAAYMNNDSGIFGGCPNFGGGMGMGMGMGMMGGFNSSMMNMSPIDYAKYQEQMENYQIDKQVRQKHKIANAEFSSIAADDAITRQIGVLQRKIKENEQDTVMKEYNKLVLNVENKLKEGGHIGEHTNKDQIKAHAEKMYFEATGKSVTDALAESGDSGFTKGLKDGFGGIGWMFTDKKSYEDNIADITGSPKNSTSSTWQKIGTGVSALLTGGLLLFGGIKGVKALRP